jgi:putative ABC transport system permease protein
MGPAGSLAWANINILAGIALALSAVLFFSALATLLSLGGSVSAMSEGLSAAHIMLIGDYLADPPEEVARWFKDRPEVAAMSPAIAVAQTRESISFEGREIKTMLIIAERPTEDYGIDRLYIVAGGAGGGGAVASRCPGADEIWVPSKFARANGIRVGDRLGIPTPSGRAELTVSALVVDPLYNSGSVNPIRVWIGPGRLPFMFPVMTLQSYMLSVRLSDPRDLNAVKAAFSNEISFSGISMPCDLLIATYSIFSVIIGTAVLVVAVLALIASLFFITATVRSAIHAEYRAIGILKTVGFTTGELRRAYLAQYAAVCIVSLVPGLIAGRALLSILLSGLTDSIGTVFLHFPAGIVALSTAGVYLASVALTVLRSSRRTGDVTPVQAIRWGAPPEKAGLWRDRTLIGLRRLGLSMFLAVRYLLLGKYKLFVSLLTSVFAIFCIVLPVNFLSTISFGLKHPEVWGYVSADLNVELTGRRFRITAERFAGAMRDERAVREMFAADWLIAQIPGDSGTAPFEIVGSWYEGDQSRLGLRLVRGAHPNSPREIAIATGTSRKFGIDVGDEMTLFIEGQRATYAVSGVFQTMNNLGQGFRLTKEAVLELNPLLKPAHFYLRIDPAVQSPSSFADYLESRYGEAAAVTLVSEDFAIIGTVIAMVQGFILIVGLVFAVVLSALAFNNTIMSVREYGHSYGLFKAMGLTPLQIRLSVALKSLLVSVLAAAAGIPLSVALGPLVFDGLGTALGGFHFPFSPDWPGSFAVGACVVAVMAASAWIASRRVRLISPRVLIKE